MAAGAMTEAGRGVQEAKTLAALFKMLGIGKDMAEAGNLGGAAGEMLEKEEPAKTETPAPQAGPPPPPQQISGSRAVPTGINEPGSENWMRWSQMTGEKKDPISVLKALAGGGGTMSREDILTGNRPSDIMARQMYEQDKRKEAIMDMLTSDNPARQQRGQQMLQAMQMMYGVERQPAVDQYTDAATQLQGRTAQTQAQADMQRALAEQMKAEATMGRPMEEVKSQLFFISSLLDAIAPDAPPDKRKDLLMQLAGMVWGISPDQLTLVE
jgi:hypothetical protein